MTEVPKIVRDRLQAAGFPGSGHPDADLLTAFAEQALPATERESVLAHLALCAECREVTALALPAETAPARIPEPVEATQPVFTPARSRSWTRSLGWSFSRWGALAAGVILAGSLLLLYRGKQNAPATPNTQVAVNLPPASAPQNAPSEKQPEPPAEAAKVASPSSVAVPLVGASGMMKVERKLEAKPPVLAEERSAAAPPAAMLDSPARGAKENVEVTGAVEVASGAAPAAADTLSARNEVVAVAKAKAPVQEADLGARDKKTAATALAPAAPSLQYSITPSKDAGAVMMRARISPPTWSVSNGVLRRSVDNGQNWRENLHADHPLLCVASRGPLVWTGGAAGTVYRSADTGHTWEQVKPSIGSRILEADVVKIELLIPKIVLSLSNHEIWTSPDGGQTWEQSGEKQ